jgi:hypothetical protein
MDATNIDETEMDSHTRIIRTQIVDLCRYFMCKRKSESKKRSALEMEEFLSEKRYKVQDEKEENANKK